MPALGLFDLLVAAVAAVGYGIGRKRGLLWQLSGVATLLVGGACATVLCGPVGAHVLAGVMGRFVAWVGIYVVVAICLYLLSLRLKHRIEELELDELDERFGGMLGAFKALLVFAVITLVAVGLSDRLAWAVRSSASGRALHVLVEELRPYMPEQIDAALTPSPTGPAPSPPATAPGSPAARRPDASLSPAVRATPASSSPIPPPSAPLSRPRPAPEGPVPFGPAPPPGARPRHDPMPEGRGSPLESTRTSAEPSRAPAASDSDPFDPETLPVDPLAPKRDGSR